MEQSDLDLHCLLRFICPNSRNVYGILKKPTSFVWIKILARSTIYNIKIVLRMEREVILKKKEFRSSRCYGAWPVLHISLPDMNRLN